MALKALALIAVLVLALGVSGCGPKNESSKGGCLWHWNRAANEAVRDDAKTFAGDKATLGHVAEAECGLEVTTDDGPRAWELVTNGDGSYKWAPTKRPLDFSEPRSGTIARNGKFEDEFTKGDT